MNQLVECAAVNAWASTMASLPGWAVCWLMLACLTSVCSRRR